MYIQGEILFLLNHVPFTIKIKREKRFQIKIRTSIITSHLFGSFVWFSFSFCYFSLIVFLSTSTKLLKAVMCLLGNENRLNQFNVILSHPPFSTLFTFPSIHILSLPIAAVWTVKEKKKSFFHSDTVRSGMKLEKNEIKWLSSSKDLKLWSCMYLHTYVLLCYVPRLQSNVYTNICRHKKETNHGKCSYVLSRLHRCIYECRCSLRWLNTKGHEYINVENCDVHMYVYEKIVIYVGNYCLDN